MTRAVPEFSVHLLMPGGPAVLSRHHKAETCLRALVRAMCRWPNLKPWAQRDGEVVPLGNLAQLAVRGE